MYQFCYSENIHDSMLEAKKREFQILDCSLSLLAEARDCKSDSQKTAAALFYTTHVWIFLIEDLSQSDNQLSEDLRTKLVSIGLWILKECGRIHCHESENYQGIIDVISLVRSGLE